VISQVIQHPKGDDIGGHQLLLSVKHLELSEPLDPTSLWVGEENVIYCQVREDRLPARFLRPAYYQLAEFIHEDRTQNQFYLSFEGKRYNIDCKKQGSEDN
jgi:hypothetical protein